MNSNTTFGRCLVMHTQSDTQICSTHEGVEHRGNPRSTNLPLHNIWLIPVCVCARAIVDGTPINWFCTTTNEFYNIYKHFMHKF